MTLPPLPDVVEKVPFPVYIESTTPLGGLKGVSWRESGVDLFVNEERITFEAGTTPGMIRDRRFPGADVIILNGHPVEPGHPLKAGDRLIFIKRGEVPGKTVLEALLTARHTPEVFARMKEATVGIAGVGGLGSNVAVALARMGVGRLIVADFDVVEPSNLNRQHYFVDQIGRPKTEAIRETLEQVNPHCRVEAHQITLRPDNIPAVFAGSRVVVEAFDAAAAKSMLIDTVLRAMPGVPVIAASGLAGYGPGNDIVVRKVAERFWVVGDLTAEARVGQGLMAARVVIAAGQQANAVVRLLMGEDPVGGS
jgi:sulfur carrier protein ThiS adenylyltransferase